MEKLGVSTPGEAITKIAFNPDDLSDAERNVAKRIIPFYTFTKKNLAFQISNLPQNATNYHKLHKAIGSMWSATGVSQEDLQEYQKNGSQIPIPFLSDEEDITYLKANLPTSDLYEWLPQNVVGKIASSSSPVIKGFYEQASGTNTFTGRPIEDYEGQRASNSLSLLPGYAGTKKAEWAMGLLGADVPTKTVLGLADTAMSEDKGSTFATNVINMTNSSKVENVKNSNTYKTRQELQDFISLMRDSGTPIYTLDEIKDANPELASFEAYMDSILNK